MSDVTTGSTVPRRQLGRHLRDLRNQARLTVRAAARELEWSEAKIWRIETGQVAMRSHDVETICGIYGAGAEVTDVLKRLAKETKAKGWWHAYSDAIPEDFDIYIGLEESAAHFSWYESELVPGLFQTEDYARALMRADNPGASDEEIERRVHVRMARQGLLTRVAARPELAVVLNEAILRRPVGGTDVMAAQLRRLAEIGELPNVSLRVVPFSAGLHRGLMSKPFVLLHFLTDANGKETEPPVVYVDGFTGNLYLDKSAEIERFGEAFAEIVDSARGEQASIRFILRAAEEFEQ